VPSISKIKGASGARNAITVNASANGWRKRSDSGERDMHAPAGEKSSRPSPSANDPLLYYPSKESTAVAIRKKRVRDEARHKQPHIQAGDSADGAEGRKKLLTASTRHLVYYGVTRTKIGACWTHTELFSTRGGCR